MANSFVEFTFFLFLTVTRDFGTTMDNHGIAGTLKIQCKTKRIAIDVKPNRKSVNLSDLSGGEKSKTLSFFIHSLWKHLSCPFRGLDEWDVGMDAKNRRQMEKILDDKSCEQDNFQYFSSQKNQCLTIHKD